MHPSPVPHSDFVTTTTHKTLRGPRGGMVLCREQYAKDLDRAVFPGIQGGPLMHIIAAKAVCFKEALEPAFAEYQRQIVANAKRLAAALSAAGFRLVSGGTDNHLMLVDVFSKGLTGKVAEAALGKAGITVNKNAIPFDQNPPMVASGIRIGTPAMTSRGMREPEMDTIAELIARALASPDDDGGARTRAGRSRGAVPEVPALPRSVSPDDGERRAAAVGAVVRARRPARRRARRVRGARRRSSRWPRPSPTCSSDGGVLLAEAGTGTGKTLAYLVPAILSRQRVLVSTGTKNLQEQIFFKDLPVLRETLGVPFTATYMKGRGNYLCLHRFDALPNGRRRRSRGPRDETSLPSQSSTSGRARPRPAIAPRSRTCPRTCRSGRRSPRPAENCIGAECPRYNECFVTRMRQRAAESDVVIVNHHLLCADAAVRQSAFGEVIPVVPLRRSSTRRTSSRTSRRSISGSRSATTGSTISRATSIAPSVGTADPDRDAADALTRRRRATCAIARARSSPRCRCCGSRCRASAAPKPGAGRRPADAEGRRTQARRSSRALEALEATIALAQGRAGRRARRRPARRGTAERRRAS